MNIAETNASDAGWRKRKRQNENLDDHPDFKTPRVISSFYITLASESPARIYESDDSTYDSFHGRETDLCRDTSDTDSSYNSSDDSLDDIAVVEYELATTSGSDADVIEFSSSSGDDDIMIAAVAHAIYDESTTQESDFSIFADTEDSDSQTDDPELGKADYWECVKCKNKQNNPMYRYCEKCYQIRKNLFPPRPKKNRKSRSSQKSLSQQICSRNMETRVNNGNMVSNNKNIDGNKNRVTDSLNHKSSNQLNRNSAGESSNSDLNDSDSDYDNNFLTKSPKLSKKRKRISGSHLNRNSYNRKRFSTEETIITRNDIEIITEPHQKINSVTSNCRNDSFENIVVSLDSEINLKSSPNRKRTCDKISEGCIEDQPNEIKKIKMENLSENVNLENKFLKNVLDKFFNNSDTETDGSKLHSLNTLTVESTRYKDSGFSSSSSQDLSPVNNEQDYIETTALYNSSQETYCSELEEVKSNSINYPSSQETIYPISQTDSAITDNLECNLTSQTSVNSEALQRDSLSSSAESDSELVLSATPLVKTDSQLSSASPNYDGFEQCMMCLSEPKNGVFVHNTFLHSCCCYKCAVKIWSKIKRCPICNCKVKNVMKLFVH